METMAGVLLATICLFTLTVDVNCSTSTWFWRYTNTGSQLDMASYKQAFQTWPTGNFTSSLRWWDITTTTLAPTVSTIPTTTELETTPPAPPDIIESTDTIFLAIIILSCLAGLVIICATIVLIYRMMNNKKHKKTKRLRVKPLKAEQPAFPTMGMAMGMPLGMDMTGMGGMPGMMAPADTGIMTMDMTFGMGMTCQDAEAQLMQEMEQQFQVPEPTVPEVKVAIPDDSNA